MRDFHRPGRSAVYAGEAMAATSSPLASAVAVDLMRRGGNAVDAAVAAALVLGLAEPQMTGIGGDMFALLHRPGKAVRGLNASGRAPRGMNAGALRAAGQSQMPVDQAVSVTVPTAMAGFIALLETEGRIGRDAVLAPAIHYAREGIPVAPRVAFDWERDEGRLSGAARRHFLLNGKPARIGDIFRAPGQADVLEHVVREGHAGFYAGEVADDMLGTLNALGGTHSAEDFASAQPEWVEPLRGGYRGHELVELPPNGHGATALLMAAMMERFDIAALEPFGAQRAHLEAEIAKLAMDARNRFIADPATRLDHMLAPATATALAALIDPARALPDPARAAEEVHRETVYLTVVDRDRLAVSLIYSIFHGFGSGIATERFGILFQNRGAGFSLVPGHPNEAAPGKRPMHTIIPAMLMKGEELVMPFGVMGGQYQPTGHMRVLSNILDYGMELQEAIDAPRSFASAEGLALERGYEPIARGGLAARGHILVEPEMPLGGAQAIRFLPSGVLEGASDPRKDGCALGY